MLLSLKGSIAPLKSYIEALYNNFEFLLNFNNLLELITATDTNDIIRLLSAHILVTVFELKLQKKGKLFKNKNFEISIYFLYRYKHPRGTSTFTSNFTGNI